MSLRDQSFSSFSDDSRGVSTVIGFIFIFAIVIILLSVYQAQFVPQENREVEFRHFQEAQSDMVEIRSAIATAGQADVSQYPTIRLGTTYPRSEEHTSELQSLSHNSYAVFCLKKKTPIRGALLRQWRCAEDIPALPASGSNAHRNRCRKRAA